MNEMNEMNEKGLCCRKSREHLSLLGLSRTIIIRRERMNERQAERSLDG